VKIKGGYQGKQGKGGKGSGGYQPTQEFLSPRENQGNQEGGRDRGKGGLRTKGKSPFGFIGVEGHIFKLVKKGSGGCLGRIYTSRQKPQNKKPNQGGQEKNIKAPTFFLKTGKWGFRKNLAP